MGGQRNIAVGEYFRVARVVVSSVEFPQLLQFQIRDLGGVAAGVVDRREDVVLETNIEEVGGVGHLALHFIVDDALEEEGGGDIGEVFGAHAPAFLLEVRFLQERTEGGVEVDGAQVLVVNWICGGEGVSSVVVGGEGVHVVPGKRGCEVSTGEYIGDIGGTCDRLRFSILKKGSLTGYLSKESVSDINVKIKW